MGNPHSVPTFFALIVYGKTTTAKNLTTIFKMHNKWIWIKMKVKKQHINHSIKTNCHNLNHMCNDEHGDWGAF